MFTEDREPERRGGNYSDIPDDHPDLPRRHSVSQDLRQSFSNMLLLIEMIEDGGCGLDIRDVRQMWKDSHRRFVMSLGRAHRLMNRYSLKMREKEATNDPH